jgi:hypothetical protein
VIYSFFSACPERIYPPATKSITNHFRKRRIRPENPNPLISQSREITTDLCSRLDAPETID